MSTDSATKPGNIWLRAVPLALSIAIGCAMLFGTRGYRFYRPPNYGGFEPADTQRGAVEILHTGRTDMDFQPTGYSYLVAVVYLLLPPAPVSMLAVQIACLPIAVWAIGRLAGAFGGPALEPWGRWAGCLYFPLAYDAAAFNNIFMTFLWTTLCVVWLLPLLNGPRSWRRSLLVGFGLGVVVCMRANYAILGIALALVIWKETRSFREAVIRSAPIAAASLAMLVAMTLLNPPAPGQLVRGSQAAYRSMLMATYQYQDQWWDWDWYEDPKRPESKPWFDHIHRIERETGATLTHQTGKGSNKSGSAEREDEFHITPAAQAELRHDAIERIVGLPWNTLKKIAISTVRIWILFPTKSSLPAKIAIAAPEFALLALAVSGFALMWARGGLWALALAVMFVPTFWAWSLHVEPRYSLPGRGVELALAVIALDAIWRRRKRCQEPISALRGESARSPENRFLTPFSAATEAARPAV